LLCLALTSALAATVNWKNDPQCITGAVAFESTACWDTAQLPTEADDVIISFPATSAGGGVVVQTAIKVKSITVNGPALLKFATAATADVVNVNDAAGLLFNDKIEAALKVVNINSGGTLFLYFNTILNTLNVMNGKIYSQTATDVVVLTTNSTLSSATFASKNKVRIAWLSGSCQIVGNTKLSDLVGLTFLGDATIPSSIYIASPITIAGGVSVIVASDVTMYINSTMTISTTLSVQGGNLVFRRDTLDKPTISGALIFLEANTSLIVNMNAIDGTEGMKHWNIISGKIQLNSASTYKIKVNTNSSIPAFSCVGPLSIYQEPTGVTVDVQNLYIGIPAYKPMIAAPSINALPAGSNTVNVTFDFLHLADPNDKKCLIEIDGITPSYTVAKDLLLYDSQIILQGKANVPQGSATFYKVPSGSHSYQVTVSYRDVFFNEVELFSPTVLLTLQDLVKPPRTKNDASRVGGLAVLVLIALAMF